MAGFVKRWERFWRTIPGQVLLSAIYLAMLCAVLVCFTGNGTFIYEGF